MKFGDLVQSSEWSVHIVTLMCVAKSITKWFNGVPGSPI